MYCYNCMCKNPDDAKICMKCGREMNAGSHPHHLKPGTILDNKYLVGNAIGEGGFGITYVGLDLTLDMKIAIKEFYPSGYANRNNTVSNKVTLNYQNEGEYFRTGRESFLREAQSIAKFHGEKSIVDVRAFFEENETAYIIVEYLDGENLSDRLKNVGTFEPAELFRMFIPVMQTLEKMHRENIIHRDISPENVRMVSDGTLKLMDFGSARYYAGMEKKTMSIQYKPGYAPYEQYNRNGNQGPWTDVYGLCATIYKCITGVTPVDTLERSQHDTLKKPSELGVNIAENLELVLMYGLAIYPQNRCQNMNDLRRFTEGALRDEKTVFGFEGSTAKPENIDETKVADEQYKTIFANANSVPRHEGLQKDVTDITPPSSEPKKKPVAVIIAIIAAVVIAAGIAGFFIFRSVNDKDKSSESSAESETTSVTEAPTAEVTDSIADKGIIMPDVSGKKLSDAANELAALELKVDTTYEDSGEVADGYVIRQSIQPERSLNKGDTVMLFVARKSEQSVPESQISETPQNDDVTLYCCASDFVTLRDRPSRTGKEITKIKLRESAKYLGSTGEFYYLEYRGEKGYALKEFLSPDKNAPINYGDGNASLKSSDTLYCCASDFASLRASASTDSDAIAKINSREEVTYLGDSNRFFYVSYQGKKGYVLKDYFSTNPNEPLNYGDN